MPPRVVVVLFHSVAVAYPAYDVAVAPAAGPRGGRAADVVGEELGAPEGSRRGARGSRARGASSARAPPRSSSGRAPRGISTFRGTFTSLAEPGDRTPLSCRLEYLQDLGPGDVGSDTILRTLFAFSGVQYAWLLGL